MKKRDLIKGEYYQILDLGLDEFHDGFKYKGIIELLEDETHLFHFSEYGEECWVGIKKEDLETMVKDSEIYYY